MGLFSSLNGGRKFDFELPEKLAEDHFLKLKELDADAILTVKSIYRNTKSKFGEHYTAIVEHPITHEFYGVNLPGFMNETCVGIINNDEMVAAINAGKVGMSRSEEMTSERGDKYYTVVWTDFE